jgi:hypothetical protein
LVPRNSARRALAPLLRNRLRTRWIGALGRFERRLIGASLSTV